MRVVSGVESNYLFYDLITHEEKIYHVSDMKPFLHDSAITNPLDVARHGLFEIFIEPITDHTCEES